MPYITISISPPSHQISIDEIFDNIMNPSFSLAPQPEMNDTNETRTTFKEKIPDALKQRIDVDYIIGEFQDFNARWAHLLSVDDTRSLYRSFTIPKRSGGRRQINAPQDELSLALNELKFILEKKCFFTHHTAAFAYVKKRCPLEAIKRHQSNNSRWFLKLDFSNFFGNTTFEFLMGQLRKIFPLSEVLATPEGEKAVGTALSLCFLNGGLPQGTSTSPLLTNEMMIPIDLEISRYARNHTPHLCYTRYADDIQISSEYSFDWDQVQSDIISILEKFNAPFALNREKTRYGSSCGRNWNLGLMLNKDNQITIGHKKKKEFKVQVYSFMNDCSKGISWDIGDVQELQGKISYYTSIEKETIDKIISAYENKFGANLKNLIKAALT